VPAPQAVSFREVSGRRTTTLMMMMMTVFQKAVPAPSFANLANGCGLVEEALWE
jgi:hypothetical protein